eukprot:4515328-Amphidinium_carterae.2
MEKESAGIALSGYFNTSGSKNLRVSVMLLEASSCNPSVKMPGCSFPFEPLLCRLRSWFGHHLVTAQCLIHRSSSGPDSP